jgi:hypothetical protein
MAPSLSIVDVAAAGLGRAIGSLPRLLAIYLLPWLLGTVALVALEAVAQDQLRLGWLAQWARNLVWAPFAAMIYLTLLRWVLGEQPPARLFDLGFGRQAWFAALVVMGWFMTADAVEAAPTAMLLWLAVPDIPAFQWEEVATLYYALRTAAWFLEATLDLCFFGLLVVIVKHGWPDFTELRDLLRLQPVRMFGIALVAAAATDGARFLLADAMARLELPPLAPHGMIPWRANIHWAFVSEFVDLPRAFLGFAIPGCILAEAYRRLIYFANPISPR